MADVSYTPGNASFNREAALRELDEKGFTVIPDVVSAHDCDQYTAEFRSWLSQFKGGDRPLQFMSVVNGAYKLGHFSSTWKVRLQAKSVFAKIWGTDKLLSSTDLVAISYPPEQGSGDFDDGTNWFHIDFSADRVGLHGYQGAFYLEETTSTDHCFRVMPGSHKWIEEYYNKFKDSAYQSTIEYKHLREEEKVWFRSKGCVPTKVPVPKGGIVLWDSRLVHDNCKPEKGRVNSDRWRFVAFVCMVPAHWARPEDLEKKKVIYKRLGLTGHWPARGLIYKKEAPIPNSSDIEIPTKMPAIAQTREARLLAGDLEYDFQDGRPNGPASPTWRKYQAA